jgi:hypothetical protein
MQTLIDMLVGVGFSESSQVFQEKISVEFDFARSAKLIQRILTPGKESPHRRRTAVSQPRSNNACRSGRLAP